jgi:hypothetical protein
MSLEEYTGRPEAFDPMLTIAGRSRAGLMDKKLHVAQAGYFTRKMVEFLYPLRISEIDCETEEGIRIDRADFEMFARCGVDFSRFLLGRYVKGRKMKAGDSLPGMMSKNTGIAILSSEPRNLAGRLTAFAPNAAG